MGIATDFGLYYTDLSNYGKVFFCCAFPATIVLVMHLILTLMGLGGDMDVDVDVDADGVSDGFGGTILPLFSLRNIEAFFTVFGWTGLVLLDAGFKPALATITATLAGIFMATLMFFIMRFIYSMSRSGTYDPSEAVGKVGTVYLRIPRKGEGYGKILVTIGGVLREVKGFSEDNAIEKGTEIEIVSCNNNVFTIKPFVRG